MQFYASPEQIMRDRSEYARKGIGRGRSVVVLTYDGGVLFVAENASTALHKVSEIYDRIGFAAVGRYNEFDNLRTGGVRLADMHGYSYDRRDVTGRQIANAYARTLGAIFTESPKPYEVEVCVAEVGATPPADELYRLSYDGSVQEEPGVVAMGGQAESISGGLRTAHRADMTLSEVLKLAVDALASVGGDAGKPRQIAASQLEVAVLDRVRPGRKFRRITGLALTTLLNGSGLAVPDTTSPDEDAAAEEKEATPRRPAPPSAEGTTHSPGLRPPPTTPHPAPAAEDAPAQAPSDGEVTPKSDG